MVITEQKPKPEILASLKDYTKVFLVGCGECATTCKTGGIAELAAMQAVLVENGKVVVGSCIPGAPCIAGQIKIELAKNAKLLREAEAIVVLACGLGAQSVKDNNRGIQAVLPACNTLCSAVMDAQGAFYEKCSSCGECVLGVTGGVCPVTLCAKGMMNGPCGGMDKGKCEVDKDRDCAWVVIYRELEKKKKLADFKAFYPARDHKKAARPHKIVC